MEVPVDEETVGPATGEDGVCVECGVRIPRKVLETLSDTFRCQACERPGETATRPGGAEELRRTA